MKKETKKKWRKKTVLKQNSIETNDKILSGKA